MEYGIIYLLSFPNGKYIGQTIQGIKIRFKEHLRDTKKGSTLPVHNALRKYKDINKVEPREMFKKITTTNQKLPKSTL
jgi:hypothetical protein